MNRQLKAFRIIFNLALSGVEILIGMRFLLVSYGSNEAVSSLFAQIRILARSFLEISGQAFGNIDISGPVAFLALVLCFMLIGAFLITFLPSLINRAEKYVVEEEFE